MANVGIIRPYRYFLYSQSQHKMRTEIEQKLGKTYRPGKILVHGRWQDYTEMSVNPPSPNGKFSDTTIVAAGYLDELDYKPSGSDWRIR